MCILRSYLSLNLESQAKYDPGWAECRTSCARNTPVQAEYEWRRWNLSKRPGNFRRMWTWDDQHEHEQHGCGRAEQIGQKWPGTEHVRRKCAWYDQCEPEQYGCGRAEPRESESDRDNHGGPPTKEFTKPQPRNSQNLNQPNHETSTKKIMKPQAEMS